MRVASGVVCTTAVAVVTGVRASSGALRGALPSQSQHHTHRRELRTTAPHRLAATTDGGSKDSDSSRNLPVCKDCGGPLKPTPTLTPSLRYLHCESCHKLYTPLLTDDSARQNGTRSEVRRSPPYPKQISDYLDRFVVGQDRAKRSLAVGVYQHYRRLEHNAESGALSIHQQRSSGQQNGMAQTPAGVFSPSSQSDVLLVQGMGDTLRVAGPTPPAVQDARFVSQAYVAQQSSQPAFSGTAQLRAPTFRALPEREPAVRLEKSNVLLIGPSGVGKTYLTQTLARVLDVPIAMCDCTSLTQAGYVGEDVESVIQKLVQNAGGNPERAQQGIVFLDEVDKIAATAAGEGHAFRDVGGEGVQHALLKLVEGTVVSVKSGKKTLSQQPEMVQVDTSDVLFIASGAFSALDKIVGRRLDRKVLGFGSTSGEKRVLADDAESEAARKKDALLAQADQGDLISFGIVPELVGRFPVIVPFHSFDLQGLVRVLTEPQNSLLAQLKLQFAIDNVDLSFSAEALEEVARQALERKTGARALRSILESVLMDAKYQVPGSDVEAVHVTRGCILGSETYHMTRKAADESEHHERPPVVATASAKGV